MNKIPTIKMDFKTSFSQINTNSDSHSTNNYLVSDIIIDKPKLTKYDIIIKSIKATESTVKKIMNKKIDYLNEDIYIFEIEGETSLSPYSWKIYKTIKQIKELFDQMKKEMSKREVVDNNIIAKCKLIKNYTSGEVFKNIDKIIEYMMYIYNATNPNPPESLKEALRISKISFSDGNGIKPFEGYALKKAEPRGMRNVLKYIFPPSEYIFFHAWNKRWIVLKNDMICYLNSPNILIGKNVYWFDEEIYLIVDKDKNLTVKNLSRSLTLKFDSGFERDLWQKEIESRIELKKEEIMSNKYHSFTSQKINCGAKWFVDGNSYFSYLFEQLKNAKESVYITDWFMSPELALKRPLSYKTFLDEKNDYRKNLNFSNASRLMDIFYLLAKKGVKIYILLFYEVDKVLSVNSLYTKNILMRLHENIKVTRHPKGISTLLWSHHEKLVIIDQKIAFVGGLDLCWGRYDTNDHPIVEEKNEKELYNYPGSDYINERQVDLHEVEKYYIEQIDRNSMPRMAWHDVHTMVEGPIVSDIVRHFVERWNDARFNTRNNALVDVGDTQSNLGYDKRFKFNRKDKNKKKKLSDDDLMNYNRYQRLSRTLEGSEIEENLENENQEGIKEENEEEVEIELENNCNGFLKDNSWNYKSSGNKDKKKIVCPDPDSDSDNGSDRDSVNNKGRFELFSALKNKVKNKYDNYKSKRLNQNAFLADDYEIKDQNIEMNFKIQALRSVSEWSIGKTVTEHSILEGYYNLIDNAKHYIYIENQFFITKSYSSEERDKTGYNLNSLVENEIGLHIRTRIEKAYEKKENFKVFICIPLLPGFSGTPGESSTMNCILKHTFQSISHNKGKSLLELLYKKMGDDLHNYIYFFSLRNHGTIKDVPVTELIYVHSKLMIVDDEKVLIGSANINDRSMLGNRDSEFAVIIEKENKVDSTMDNKSYKASEYALSLRKHLMSEHIGLQIDDELLNDPLDEKLWSEMRSRANVNSMIYSDIFDCFPDNQYNSFAKLKERRLFKGEKDKKDLITDYKNKIIGVRGHIVEYPVEFLKDEELDIDFFSKENLVPEKNFT